MLLKELSSKIKVLSHELVVFSEEVIAPFDIVNHAGPNILNNM